MFPMETSTGNFNQNIFKLEGRLLKNNKTFFFQVSKQRSDIGLEYFPVQGLRTVQHPVALSLPLTFLDSLASGGASTCPEEHDPRHKLGFQNEYTEPAIQQVGEQD